MHTEVTLIHQNEGEKKKTLNRTEVIHVDDEPINFFFVYSPTIDYIGS